MGSGVKIRLAITAFGLMCLVALVVALFPISFIKFNVAPNDVVVLIDNNKHFIKNGDTIFVAPGKHTVVVFEDEFNPEEQQLDVGYKATYNLTSVLMPLTESAKEKLKNKESGMVMEKADAIFQSKLDKITTGKYPVIDILPIEARYYTIYQCTSKKYIADPTAEAICIDVNPPSLNSGWDYRSDALDNLKSNTFYEINEYEIIWNVTLPDGSVVEQN